jgi:hypothetical protein
MWRNCIVWFAGIETDMFKEIIVLDTVTVSTILGKWLRPGLKRKWGILCGEMRFSMPCLIHILLLTTWQAVAAVLNLLFSLLIFCIFLSVKLCQKASFFVEEWTYFEGAPPFLVRQIGNVLVLYLNLSFSVTLVSEWEQLKSGAQSRCSWGFMYWWWNS